MAATRDPTEAMIRSMLRMQRAGSSLTAEGRRSLERLFAKLQADLVRLDPTGVQKRYQALRMDKFFKEMAGTVREWTPEHEKILRDGLVEIGRAQSVAAADALVVSLGGPVVAAQVAGAIVPGITQQRLRAILNTEPFEGRLLAGHVKKIGVNIVDKTMVQIRIGMTNEESIRDIVGRVRGILGTSTRETEALVRTAVTQVSGKGQLATLRANKDVVSLVRYVATLDDRTTEECFELDGKVWPVDSPEIVEPGFHWGCRSALVGEIDWAQFGLEPPPEGERFARDMSSVAPADLKKSVAARRRMGLKGLGQRAQVPAKMTGEQWLKQQSAAVQNKVLGRGKAELFRSGQITLKDLIRRDRTVRPLREVLKRVG